MSDDGLAVAHAASELVGVPFRLHGRDPEQGLDCIGVAACALKAAGFQAIAPCGYSLSNSSIDRHLRCAGASGLEPAESPVQPGDIVLVTPGPAQHHLLVADAAGGFVHAHAGLRRVVNVPAPLPWPVIRIWRPKPRIED